MQRNLKDDPILYKFQSPLTHPYISSYLNNRALIPKKSFIKPHGRFIKLPSLIYQQPSTPSLPIKTRQTNKQSLQSQPPLQYSSPPSHPSFSRQNTQFSTHFTTLSLDYPFSHLSNHSRPTKKLRQFRHRSQNGLTPQKQPAYQKPKTHQSQRPSLKQYLKKNYKPVTNSKDLRQTYRKYSQQKKSSKLQPIKTYLKIPPGYFIQHLKKPSQI